MTTKNNDLYSLSNSLLAMPATADNDLPSSINIWMIISFCLILICIIESIIIIKQKKAISKPLHQPKDTLRGIVQSDEPVDFGNIMNSAFQSKHLYDKLKRKCHPDLFATNPDLFPVADDIFQRITQNKTNYKVLQQLQQEAQEKLHIQF